MDDNNYKYIKCDLVRDLIQKLNSNKRLRIDIKKDLPLIKSPADLDEVLHELGWSLDDSDINGWEPDCWNYYFNEDYEFGLIVNYNGFYWNLELYRTDIDDD